MTFGYLLPLLLCIGVVPAQAQHRDLNMVGKPIPSMPPDAAIPNADIVDALSRVSVANICHTIDKLVSFHTRSMLFSMDTDLPPGQGIKPAIAGVTDQFDAYSKARGGCLVIKHASYTQMPGETGYLKRIPGCRPYRPLYP